ncbi:VWA domain-containing protein [Deinococcus sp. LM3]|uniref:VWA domain-containing protein n=1 Tax=Deinococcus sp. LM3 TaxID=1938608 RepID=UPI001F0AF38E|nr:VWA domain-containing protein [Deinococcus sp. LM3]
MSGLGAVPPDLAAQVSAFTARLRDRHGFLIGPGETADALRALGAVDVLERREVRGALRAVLSASPEQLRLFDLEFNAFFRVEGAAQPKLPPLLPETKAPGGEEQTDPGPPPPPQPGQRPAPKPTRAPTPDDAPDPDEDAPDSQAPGQPLAGEDQAPPDDAAVPSLRARLSPNAAPGQAVQAGGDDLPDLLRAASALVRSLQLGRARRLKPQPNRGPKLDARRTLRAAARTAGDATLLRWLGRPRRAPRFLLLIDGSRSMGADATLLLRFAQALHLRSRRVEVYAFSTGLTRLTPLLRRAPPGVPLTLPDLGDAWGGGTRIGENLLRLAREERAHVNRDTLILILSDGLDTGEPALVGRALRDLERRAGGVVWLSPLAAGPNYRPVQRAVAAALPFLDALLPVAGVDDLHALPRRLRAARRS